VLLWELRLCSSANWAAAADGTRFFPFIVVGLGSGFEFGLGLGLGLGLGGEAKVDAGGPRFPFSSIEILRNGVFSIILIKDGIGLSLIRRRLATRLQCSSESSRGWFFVNNPVGDCEKSSEFR
tara:strand:- start:112 stop:480 length:369 start_codon:yes stop_codon:yes gene_type:complete